MNKGQSLFEVVVALAISALIIITLVSVVGNSIKNATFSKNKTLAANYAQEATEWLRGQRDLNIKTFMTKALIPTWCLNNLSWTIPGACSGSSQITGTPFTRNANFVITTPIPGKTLVEASVIVSWTDSGGNHQVKSATSFSDWRQR